MFRSFRAAALLAVAGMALFAAGCTGGTPSRDNPTPAPTGTGARTGPDVYAACMREHGVAEFPDPGPSGLLRIGPQDTFDTESPQYLAAYQICQELA
jgi:hypothetical protein